MATDLTNKPAKQSQVQRFAGSLRLWYASPCVCGKTIRRKELAKTITIVHHVHENTKLVLILHNLNTLQ